MKHFFVKIVMPDGSTGSHHGMYTDGCNAIICALDHFPEAKRISAKREGA